LEIKEIENTLTLEIVNAVQKVGGKAAFKAVMEIAKHCGLEPAQLEYVSKYFKMCANTARVEKAKSEGKALTKRLDSDMLVEGLVYILENKTTPEETMEYIRQRYNQPDDWIGKVKNRPIPKQERTNAVRKLKEEDIPLLDHLISDKRTTFKEISEPETWNKQLGEIRRTITLSDRVDKLEQENRELLLFKEQQIKLNEEQALFNLAVVNEFENQKKLILSGLNLSPELLGVTEHEVLSLANNLSTLPTEQSRWKHILDQGYTKVFLSKLTGIPYATLKRKLKKYQIS
jgi:hypothetical protein